MKRTIKLLVILAIGLSLLFVQPVQADIAPPEAPPGSTLWPGSEATQVRMLAETVILTVSADPADPQKAVARTTALFNMRNLGTQAEQMQARFPLRFLMWNDETYPEIANLRVKVNGRGVSTQRQVLTYTEVRDLWAEYVEIPWSVFDVTFPPGEDVSVEVTYSVHGFGYYPWQAFRYILETGAGWKGSIGSADIIVRLPYDAHPYNVWLNAQTGFSTTTPAAQLSGNEVRWRFEDLEPTYQDNIEVSLVTPSLWEKILRERAIVERNPKDGEAWGRLAKAYKEISRMYKGYPREDPDGLGLMDASRRAYEKCLELLPRDSLWHTGYAELLWNEYYFLTYSYSNEDPAGRLPTALAHLQTALELDPANTLARDLLDNISYAMPEAVVKKEEGYDFLALTATPRPPTLVFSPVPTATITASPVVTIPVDAATPVIIFTPIPTPTPAGRSLPPLCGGAGLILPLLGAAFWRRRRR